MAKAGYGMKEIKEALSKAHPNGQLSERQIYRLIRQVKDGRDTEDQRKFNPKKTRRSVETIAAVQAAVESDRRTTIEELAAEFDLSVGTVHTILHEDLGLSKKSARWVPRLLSMEQKAERVR